MTHLEPDILECEVKWALESITTNKASGGDGIPVELFQILKDDAVKMLHSLCQQIWKTQQWPQDWKRSVFIPVPKKGNVKEFHTTAQLHSFHMLARSWSKSFKLGFSSPWSKSRCFSGTPLPSPWSNEYWQFDLWFFCLFNIQLVDLKAVGSNTAEA